jgi:hypothetical protein
MIKSNWPIKNLIMPMNFIDVKEASQLNSLNF